MEVSGVGFRVSVKGDSGQKTEVRRQRILNSECGKGNEGTKGKRWCRVSALPLAQKVYPPQEGGQFNRKINFVIFHQLFLDCGSGFFNLILSKVNRD
jgi:hypothetical protein